MNVRRARHAPCPWLTALAHAQRPHLTPFLCARAESLVLLKNEPTSNGRAALPLPLGIRLAVVGPLATETTGLLSDYGKWASAQPPPSIADALTRANEGGRTDVAAGVQVADDSDRSGVGAALQAVRGAEAVVLALGITHAQERETHDRAHTSLPGLQLEFALNVTAAAAASHVPVVIVLCNGGMVSVDEARAPPEAATVATYNGPLPVRSL
jgi:beta-xylosidase